MYLSYDSAKIIHNHSCQCSEIKMCEIDSAPLPFPLTPFPLWHWMQAVFSFPSFIPDEKMEWKNAACTWHRLRQPELTSRQHFATLRSFWGEHCQTTIEYYTYCHGIGWGGAAIRRVARMSRRCRTPREVGLLADTAAVGRGSIHRWHVDTIPGSMGSSDLALIQHNTDVFFVVPLRHVFW